ncbi:DMT family transporter [Ochrobactrum sp. BTU1]|uniref:DMT family transporter n=1 Tax=Ochrobactrum sp. BTU1 TaxID=2840456 RepID=UPI001C055E9C|nr:DMT family transporter [Ochrobactrum sp. BTU1]
MIPLRFLGAALVCVSSLAFTLNDTTTKFLIADYDVSSIILIRSLMALPILYLFHVRTSGRRKIWSARIGLHALRGAFGLIAAYLYIASLKTLTVAEATVILFMTPVLITAMTRFLLKENVSIRSWLSVCFCFLGVIVAINPRASSFNYAIALVGTSSVFYAINAISSRLIPSEDNLWTISFFGAFFSALFIAPFAIEHWRVVQVPHLAQFGAAAAFSSLGIGLSAIAYRMTSPALLAPFGYSGLIWSITATWLFWGVHPSLNAILGTLIILGSVTLTIKPGRIDPQPHLQNCIKGPTNDEPDPCRPE